MKIITLEEVRGRLAQPPQWFSFGVLYNSFSSPDDHGMNVTAINMANHKTSIEIRQSGDNQA